MSRFNLIDEPWIPVRFPDGRRDALGIRDILLRAGEIAAIEDPSPLVVAALHRFLLAVLYRALQGPTDIEQAKTLFRNGLPGEKIESYIEKQRERFWLFHTDYPFGQIPTFAPRIWRAWTALAAEHNADNAKVLFDHVDINLPGTISEAAGARWMLAAQTFSVSAGKSELAHTGTAPAATAAMAIPIGRNLLDTLLFALVPQQREITLADRPLWERTPETFDELKRGPSRPVTGLADLYTWRIRSIRFDPDVSTGIARVAFASGVGNSSEDLIDPMVGYRIDERRGKLPVQFRDRGLWRDFDSLLPDDSRLSPRVIEHAAALTRFDFKRFPQSVIVCGLANDKAKIRYWRLERFVLPQALATDRFIRSEIRTLLNDAEDSEQVMEKACGVFARHILSRGGRKPERRDIKAFIEQLSVYGLYWSILESRFNEILGEYTADRDFEDIRHKWLKWVRDALATAWEQHRMMISAGDAWAIRALVKAERHIQHQLKSLQNEIAQLDPQKEEA